MDRAEMNKAGYRLDWKRPLTHAAQGQHHYYATNGEQHILVIVTDAQIMLAEGLACSMRSRDGEILVQDAIEEAIATALYRRPGSYGALRLEDSDFE